MLHEEAIPRRPLALVFEAGVGSVRPNQQMMKKDIREGAAQKTSSSSPDQERGWMMARNALVLPDLIQSDSRD